MTLEEIQTDATINGILRDANVTVIRVEWHGSDALTLVYRDPAGKVDDEIIYRHDEARMELVETGRQWSFDGDGSQFRLVAKAHRIRLAHLCDPVLAIHTSTDRSVASPDAGFTPCASARSAQSKLWPTTPAFRAGPRSSGWLANVMAEQQELLQSDKMGVNL
jgi:hypothetical protein